ncbi:DUF3313 domain-containing protein [Sphingomonas sp. HDW15A]|uniref:DUF3313 domain-containing protein n=1 Tax=Sphingomonas sp. HDW15A TaxID=2714942 RepID=UPI001407A988|nr:DUF3313 domain-containing protein [Sphingomonas sp. HDW15A]QIK95367.1 DUF3313 domain-containing protein [Sphingomonas sp. HDW15A]
MRADAISRFRCLLPATAILIAAPAVSQTRDHAPVSLPSARVMAQDKAGSESWTYARPASEFRKYRTVMIPAAIVYQGPDAQFEGISQADRAKFADMITQELRTEMAKSFPAPASPQTDTLRLQVTILGATKTTGGIATATRVTGLGFATSALKSVLGKPGSLTGSILYAVELYDARTNELMLAAVRRRTPDPLDVPATISQTETVKAVAREFADGARKRLVALTGAGQ